MKRVLATDHVIVCCNEAAAANNGFPLPALLVMEAYLSDTDLSMLARCCRTHMVLCYARAKRSFKWGKNPSIFYMYNYNFPADQFLQMQLAKALLVSTGEPDVMTRHIDGIKNIASMSFDELTTSLSCAIPLKLSFARYMEKVCFVDAKVITTDPEVSKNRQVQTPRELFAIYILCKHPIAKCSFAVQTNNIDIYNVWRPRIHETQSFCKLALSVCTSRDHDTSIIHREIFLGVKHNKREVEDAVSDLSEETVTNSKRNFQFYEHPLVCAMLLEVGLTDPKRWFDELLFNDNNNAGPLRCMSLMHHLKMSEEKVLEIFISEEFSFIYENVDENRKTNLKSHYHNFASWCDVRHITLLLEFPVTRLVTLKRLEAYAQINWFRKKYAQFLQK